MSGNNIICTNNQNYWAVTTVNGCYIDPCAGVDANLLQSAFYTVESNPKYTRWHPQTFAFERAEAMLHLVNQQPRLALKDFNAAITTRPSPKTAMEQATVLEHFGWPGLAIQHLNFFSALPNHSDHSVSMAGFHAWILTRQQWWQPQIAALRKHLTAEIERRPEIPAHRGAQTVMEPVHASL